jgi:hypothetical protein
MRHVTRSIWAALLAVVCVVTWSAAGRQNSSRAAGSSVPVDQTSIGGTVVNSAGGKPEAGVWVIAETKSLPAPFRKIVATDDQGRFLVPDLPGGAYEL